MRLIANVFGGSSTALWFSAYGSAGQTATFTFASAKFIPGNHSGAQSDATRPLYKVTGLAKWNDFDWLMMF